MFDASKFTFDASKSGSDAPKFTFDASKSGSDASKTEFDASEPASDVPKFVSDASDPVARVARHPGAGPPAAGRGPIGPGRGPVDPCRCSRAAIASAVRPRRRCALPLDPLPEPDHMDQDPSRTPAPPSRTDESDRGRLEGIQQSDLNESRVNEDFLAWLKTSGWQYLAGLLVFMCVYLGYVNIKASRAAYRVEAWQALDQADLPESLTEVAESYGDVGAIGSLARLRAAEAWMNSVQRNRVIGATFDPATGQSASTAALSDEERAHYLASADGEYQAIIAADDGSPGRTLITLAAFYGRAAVAEAEERYDQAELFYEQAADRAEPFYPGKAEQARARAASIGAIQGTSRMFSREQIQSMRNASATSSEQRRAVRLEPILEQIIQDAARSIDGTAGGTAPRP